MFERFSHVMFYSTDPEASVAWYREVLGFAPLFTSPEYSATRHDGLAVQFDFHKGRSGPPGGEAPVPYFAVADLDAAVAALAGKGVAVRDVTRQEGIPAHAAFDDPDGNALGLVEAR